MTFQVSHYEVYAYIAINNALENVHIFLKVLCTLGLTTPPFPPPPYHMELLSLSLSLFSYPIAKIARSLERHHDALSNCIQTHVSERICSIPDITLYIMSHRIENRGGRVERSNPRLSVCLDSSHNSLDSITPLTNLIQDEALRALVAVWVDESPVHDPLIRCTAVDLRRGEGRRAVDGAIIQAFLIVMGRHKPFRQAEKRTTIGRLQEALALETSTDRKLFASFRFISARASSGRQEQTTYRDQTKRAMTS